MGKDQISNLFRLNEIKLSYIYKDMPKTKILTSKDTFELVAPFWDDIEYRESVYAIYLNRANYVLYISCISKGSTVGTIVDPKIVFQGALMTNAHSFILVHNHPSRNLMPSKSDISTTEKLKNAGIFLEIPILDHLIITRDNYYSFADEGFV